MPVETVADLAAFFVTDEFAEAAQWSRAGGWDPVAVNVIMERPDVLAVVGDVAVRAPVYQATLRVSELPAGAARGDRLLITLTGEDFTVIKPLERDETRRVVRAELRPTAD